MERFSRHWVIKQGFTLIEIMIVIALLGILMAIVLTKFSDARNVSREGRSMEELKNITLALELYREQVGSLPASGSGETWENQVLPAIELQTAARLPARDPWGTHYSYSNNFGGSSAGLPTLVCSGGINRSVETTNAHAGGGVAQGDDLCVFLIEPDDS